MTTSRKRNSEELTDDPYQESTLTYHSEWSDPHKIDYAIVLPDGKHFITLTEVELEYRVEIWNIESQKTTWDFVFSTRYTYAEVVAFLLLKDDKVAILTEFGMLQILKFNLQDKTYTLNFLKINSSSIISAATILTNGFLAFGYENGLVTIVNLSRQNQVRTFETSCYSITAMTAGQNGSLIIGNDEGCIFIYDPETDRCTQCPIDTKHIGSIQSLILLPDNTIVFGDGVGYLQHWDCNDFTMLGYQKIGYNNLGLITTTTGLLGCFGSDYLKFFEPLWRRQIPEVKNVLTNSFPEPLIDIVVEYLVGSTVKTLFNPPKKLQKKTCVLEEKMLKKLHF